MFWLYKGAECEFRAENRVKSATRGLTCYELNDPTSERSATFARYGSKRVRHRPVKAQTGACLRVIFSFSHSAQHWPKVHMLGPFPSSSSRTLPTPQFFLIIKFESLCTILSRASSCPPCCDSGISAMAYSNYFRSPLVPYSPA